MRELIYTLEWAKVSLYPLLTNSSSRARPFGEPDTLNPTIELSEASGLRLIHRPNFVWKRPTGRRHPIGRHLGAEHIIEIEKLWIQESGTINVELEENTCYTLQVVWKEAPPWDPPIALGRTYYGVYTTQSQLRPGDGNAFVGEQALTAAYYGTIYNNEQVP